MSEGPKDFPPENYPSMSGAAVYESMVQHLRQENEALRAERDYWKAQADAAYRDPDETPENELPPAA
jgi:hypothetical protein